MTHEAQFWNVRQTEPWEGRRAGRQECEEFSNAGRAQERGRGESEKSQWAEQENKPDCRLVTDTALQRSFEGLCGEMLLGLLHLSRDSIDT